jgi:hypothetical protein
MVWLGGESAPLVGPPPGSSQAEPALAAGLTSQLEPALVVGPASRPAWPSNPPGPRAFGGSRSGAVSEGTSDCRPIGQALLERCGSNRIKLG